MSLRTMLLTLLVTLGCQAPPPAGPNVPPGFVLHYRQGFDDPKSESDFACSDEAPWVWNRDGSFDLVGESAYLPPHRSPRSLALLRHIEFGDFVMELDVLQSGREYGHRDLCLVFGFVDPANYYYVHLATTPDPNAHNVFLVDDAPRRPLAPVARQGVDWGRGQWHRVRLERLRGRIRVFFDDFERPLFDLVDGTHGAGRIGFGSFDDTGRFDNLNVWAASSSGFNQDPFGR